MAVPVSSLSMAGTGNPLPDPVEKDWAVYIYCGADNDYDVSAEFALEQCEKGLAAADGVVDPISVHVVMYLDTKGPSNTVVYDLSSGEAIPVDMMDNGECDSSDSATLMQFLTRAMDHYPSANTMLIVKNGHAWCGVCPDDDATEEAYLMPINDLARVLSSDEIQERGGVNVLALDGDNMASIEVAYELRDSCSYLVASQQDMPLDGLPYCLFMEDLASRTVPPSQEDVAATMVDKYVYYYNNTDGKKVLYDHLLSNSQMAVTASVFRMGEEGVKIQAVVDSFNNYLDYMLNGNLPDGMAEDAENRGIDVDEKLDQWMFLDPATGEEVWAWIPLSRNNISSARDCALIGKMSDQQGYEWLPDVYTWLWSISALSNYEAYGDAIPPSDDTPLRPELSDLKDPFVRLLLEDFMESFGYEEQGIYRSVLDPTAIDADKALVWLSQSQILDRSGNSFPHGLNIWFPPTWLQWDTFDYMRTRTYLYDGSNVELPAEYYCVDCPFDYNSIKLDFVEYTMWMDFIAAHYDSRWTIYGSGDAPKEKPAL